MQTENESRGAFALRALMYYASDKYSEAAAEVLAEGIETRATDLISDLLHLIAAHGGDPERAQRLAAMHFEAEQDDPEDSLPHRPDAIVNGQMIELKTAPEAPANPEWHVWPDFDEQGENGASIIGTPDGLPLFVSLSYAEAEDVRKAAASPRLVSSLIKAEAFISGFEDDEAQEGIAEVLSDIRAAIKQAR